MARRKPLIFNILGAQVQVITKELEDRGEAVFKKNEIYINHELEGTEYLQTLFHEITHWILYRNGMEEGHPKEVIEAICDTVGFTFSENLQALQGLRPPDKRTRKGRT